MQQPQGGVARPQQPLQPAPWYAGQNPWTGVVHAYSMPVPRAPAPGLLGSRSPSHQVLYAVPQPYVQPYGQPSQPGGPPPLPLMTPALAPPPAPWNPALLAALHSAPTPSTYTGGGDWHMDTGTSAHMAAHPGTLHTSSPVTTSTRITVGDGSSLPITHIGHASFPSTSTPLSLSNVLVSPNLIKNLVSVKQFTRDNPVTVEFDMFGFSVKDSRTRMVLRRCDSPGDLYPVHSTPSTSAAPVALATGVDLWHARLGHPNPTTLRHMFRSFSFTCNKIADHSCHACRLGKHTRLPFRASSHVASYPFELIHSDVWTSPVASNTGYIYYLVILDDFSHYVWTFPLRRKSDTLATLAAFYSYVSTQFGGPILALQTDNGKEFDNLAVRTLLTTHGTTFRLTCPYTSPQNGRAERVLRTLNDCVHTLLFHAHMPPRFWPDALSTASLLINIRPCRTRGNFAPHHLLFSAPPSYDDLRIFGCLCYPSIAATAPHKLAPRSIACVFLGYPPNTKGYRCYDPVSHRVFTS